MSKTACDQCPWRTGNQGKRHAHGFYTKANLTRLWNQLRKGGQPQSCHVTDPSHPDHVAAGAKPGATARECPGSVVLIKREMRKMADAHRCVSGASVDRYKETRKKGLTKTGILYWVVQRVQLAGQPFFGGDPLPETDDDPAVGLPKYLEE
jgi:hypothetical protein